MFTVHHSALFRMKQRNHRLLHSSSHRKSRNSIAQQQESKSFSLYHRGHQGVAVYWICAGLLFLVLSSFTLSWYCCCMKFSCGNVHLWLTSSHSNVAAAAVTTAIPTTTTAATTRLSSTLQTDGNNNDMKKSASDQQQQQQRLRLLERALWSFFAGDALASPSHWFYGRKAQVQQYYPPAGIRDYTKPVFTLPGSILNKSNLQGAGRSASRNYKSRYHKSIIGDVINHGKEDLWSPTKQIHYHATLQAGEETLEASLARVLLRCMASSATSNNNNKNNRIFDANRFRQAYVDFMMTPGSHNDTYARLV